MSNLDGLFKRLLKRFRLSISAGKACANLRQNRADVVHKADGHTNFVSIKHHFPLQLVTFFVIIGA
jgi:hypothetical protein